MTTGWVVVGADGGVGATLAAAALVRARAHRREVVYVKLVQPAAGDGADDAADVAGLTDAPTVTGPSVGPSGAPGRTVRAAGLTLTIDEFVDVLTGAGDRHPGAELVVEGAGGVLAELGSDGTTIADVARAVALPAIVVAPARPGGLELAGLSTEALTRRGVAVAGIVVTRPARSLDAGPMDPSTVLAVGGARLLADVPAFSTVDGDHLDTVAFDLDGP